MEKIRGTADAMLVTAGYEGLLAGWEFIALKFLVPLVAGPAWCLVAHGLTRAAPAIRPAFPALCLAGVLLAYAQPVLWLRGAVRKRQGQILKAMPFVLDLLTLSVEAGLDFMTAMQRSTERAVIDPLGEELLRLRDGPLHAERAGREDDLRAEELEDLAPLDGHRLGHRQDEAVSLGRRHEREADPGVARRGLDEVLEPARRRWRQLEFLHEALGNRRGKGRLSFSQWLLEQRQQELLVLASRTFSQMSSGQYGFSSQFQVVDRSSGQTRKPNTLSGGESFLASLSLALALSELVGRRGGRLEAFFLDEGFGTLSPEALDRAAAQHPGRFSRTRLPA